MKIAIIGAGWAGMAAAVTATQVGHTAIIFEAAQAIGGRARALKVMLPNGHEVMLDNGQHILIGAYTDTLKLMQTVGVDPQTALLSQPMALLFPDGRGLQFPDWPTPLDALAGILGARGWSVADKASLLRVALGWQLQGFKCDVSITVATLGQRCSPRVMAELIEPLCVSALNTPAHRASGQVFLRVMQDALFGVQGGSRLLLPRLDLSELFPSAAARWMTQRGGQLHLGARVTALQPLGAQWQLERADKADGEAGGEGEVFDAIILATSSTESARMLAESAREAPEKIAPILQAWTATAQNLAFEAITTVYAWAPNATLPHPMLALRSNEAGPGQVACPAQFVFDRGQLGGPPGLLAFVTSASTGDRDTLQKQVLMQAQTQLGLTLEAVQTVVEKRATFACTPGLERPPAAIAPGLWACGDYVAGPYPATLEGAVRSGVAAVQSLCQ
jgi:squalene-associated FAD-dependent desaturase